MHKMIFCIYLSRERAAQLHCDASFPGVARAWVAYELVDRPGECVMWIQTTHSASDVRVAFMLPRLFASSFNSMLQCILHAGGLLGDQVFAGGQFQRMLRRPPTARSLENEFNAVAEPPEVIDLTCDESLSVVPCSYVHNTEESRCC